VADGRAADRVAAATKRPLQQRSSDSSSTREWQVVVTGVAVTGGLIGLSARVPRLVRSRDDPTFGDVDFALVDVAQQHCSNGRVVPAVRK
jgi:hypothetical protein